MSRTPRNSFFIICLAGCALSIVFGVDYSKAALLAAPRDGAPPSEEIADIRRAYQATAAAIQAADLKILSLEFDRVLPGSGPQRVRARLFFSEAYEEESGGAGRPEFRARLRKVELRYNFAARKFYREILYIDGVARFAFFRESDGEDGLQRRLYFDNRRRLVARIDSAGEGPKQTRRAGALTAEDRAAGRQVQELAGMCLRMLGDALALPAAADAPQ